MGSLYRRIVLTGRCPFNLKVVRWLTKVSVLWTNQKKKYTISERAKVG